MVSLGILCPSMILLAIYTNLLLFFEYLHIIYFSSVFWSKNDIIFAHPFFIFSTTEGAVVKDYFAVFDTKVIIKTTSKLEVWTAPRRDVACWFPALKDNIEDLALQLQTATRLSILSYSPLLPVNGSVYSFHEIWSTISSSSNWFFIYSLIAFSFHPTVSTKYPLAQKFLLPYFYFKFACLSNIISALFILQNVLQHSDIVLY